jgi:hypothetical protein
VTVTKVLHALKVVATNRGARELLVGGLTALEEALGSPARKGVFFHEATKINLEVGALDAGNGYILIVTKSRTPLALKDLPRVMGF